MYGLDPTAVSPGDTQRQSHHPLLTSSLLPECREDYVVLELCILVENTLNTERHYKPNRLLCECVVYQLFTMV